MVSETVHDSGYLQPEGCEPHEKRRFTIEIRPSGLYVLRVHIWYNAGTSDKFPGGVIEAFPPRYYESLKGLNRRLSLFNMEYTPCPDQPTT